MMDDSSPKFKGKYRIESARLKGWDYAATGYYFVTICTHNRLPNFGEIKQNQMILSPAGEIAAKELEKTPQIRPNAALDAWVVMPNHIHAIIILTGTPYGGTSDIVVETPRRGVSTDDVPTIKPWKPGTLGAILNQYKSICTKRIRLAGCTDFAWQARYYDHIIRDERSLETIRRYILENPLRWESDDYHA